ncbi:MAG: glycogen/starch synthase [bacterium]
MNKKKNKLKILMLSAEVAPFAKVGGLADVVGSLPSALEKVDCDARVIVPLYGVVDRKKYNLKKIYSNAVVVSDKKKAVFNLWQSFFPGTNTPIYFIESLKYFAGEKVYSGRNDEERFLFFSSAALHALSLIKFVPDIIHCHDCHTALVPDILKVGNFENLKNVKTIYTIHNFAYQGKTDVETLKIGNLKKDSLKSLAYDALDGDINFTVQGILNADIVTTVSRRYAREILTKEYGAGLDNIIRKRKKDLYGIVNGIDIDFFNPEKDKFISKNYSVKTLKEKIRNKTALQKEVGLPVDADVPLVGMVSRFVSQKGIDLISDKFGSLDCQFVFLGTGQKKYEDMLKNFAKKFPKKVSANISFNISLAQKIYAASDMFLMPSQFEPCGLGQMIAMRYGTVPVVRATGGLDDTVDNTVGFKFKKMSSAEFYNKLKEAITIYKKNKNKWKNMQINGMKRDFSWNKSAKEYLTVYRKALKK